MLKKTIADYHPDKFNTQKYNMEDFLKVIDDYNFCGQWGEHLDCNAKNILTIQNMPWFDLGELPESYKKETDEADQVVMRPPDKFPNFVACKYGEL